MPWGIFKTGSEDKPHCVYRVNAEGERFGKSRGCHPSRHAAHLQIAAIEHAMEESGEKMEGFGQININLKAPVLMEGITDFVDTEKEVIADDESLEGEMNEIEGAFRQAFPTTSPTEMAVPSHRPWVCRTYADDGFLIVEANNLYFKVSYSRDGDEFEFAPFSEWEEVEKKEEWVTKAKVKSTPDEIKLGPLQDLKEKFASILEDFLSKIGSSDKAEGEEPENGFKTFTAKDGKTWLLIWTTNAFKDRDGEIFTTKSIEDYVERHVEEENKGEMRFWHIPGSKFADILWQGMSGRFLVEAGPFDDTYIGNAFKDFFLEHDEKHLAIAPLGWGTSHGFEYIPEDREDKVYDWFEKKESSVLPRSAASNLYNPKMEVIRVNEEQRKALEAIGGDELAQAVLEAGEELTKELEPNVAHKATDADTDAKPEADKQPEPASDKEKESEPKAEETEPETKSESEVEYMTKEEATAGFMALAEVIKEQRESIVTLAKAVKELVKSDEEKIVEKLETTPKASIAAQIKSVIGLEETRVDGRTKLAQGPEEAKPTAPESETGIPLIDEMKKRNREYGQPKEE